MKLYLLFLVLLNLIVALINGTIKGATNCYDNSYHMTRRPDYKRLYRVTDCTCPCERYAHSFKRNRCEECRHFHIAPPDTNLNPFENVPDLRALEEAVGPERMEQARIELACEESMVPKEGACRTCCYSENTAVTGVNQRWLIPAISDPFRSWVNTYR